MKVIHKFTSLVLLILVASACARSVTRVSPDTQIDLSGRWNDSDSRLVANKMVEEFLNSGRYKEYAAQSGTTPAIIVGYVSNKTSEHIDADNFIKKFEVEIFNSGEADVVESPEFREK